MSDAVLIADAHGQITQINAAYRALVGLPPDQQIPRDPAAHIAQLAIRDHDGQPVPFDEMVTQRAVRGQRILNEAAVDYQFRTLGGEDRWASATAAPLYDAQGQISGAITVLRDVTERRQAERALQRAHERFQLAERAANGFVYEWDVRAGQLYRSAGVERLLGYRPEEIPPTWEAWAQLVYPGDWQATTDAEELAYLEALPAETLETAYRLRHRDGHYLTVADYALLERDAAGHIVRLIGQTHDITQRKRAEEALRSSEERLRLLIESAEDYSIFTTDEHGVIDSWNEGARRMFGWSAQEIIGQPTELIFTPEDRAAGVPAQEMARAVKNGHAPDERFHLRKDGSRFYVSGTMSTIHDGELRGFVKIARDLTERQAAEEALRRSHDELEQRVVERTRELDSANWSLRRLSQRILEVQEGERRLLARELHDEIGQQLTGMKMLLDSLDEQLRQGPSDATDTPNVLPQAPTPIEQLTEIRAVVGDTLERVRDLSLDLRPAVLDSLGLLPALQWLFNRYTNQTGVEVDFAADGLDHRLPAQLEAGAYRLIQEALTNVARHAGVSKVTVQVYATDETLSLYIVDTGAGFDVESALAADASTGLAGMRERAALLGGSLSIESLPGEGTTIQADFSISHAIGEAARRETAEAREYVGWHTSQDNAARHLARDEVRDRERDQWRDAVRDARRDALRDASRDALHDADWRALLDRQARWREEETP
jgi:PAS domain S-box-containing protein